MNSIDNQRSQRSVGVFSSYQEADDALTELHDSGFAMNRVSIIAKDSEQLNQNDNESGTQTGNLTETTQVEEGAKTGAIGGGAVGGLTGLLVGLGTLAIPGVGPIMLAGATATALATTVAGGAIGAAAGSLVGSLIGLGVPEDRARFYNDLVVSGRYLVIVDGTEAEIEQAEAILRRRGVREWEVYTTPTSSGYEEPAIHL